MSRIVRKVKPGVSPGTLAVREARVEAVRIRVMSFGPDEVIEKECGSLEEAFALDDGKRVTWIDVVGLHDVELLAELARRFGIHPLAMEDVTNVGQRPKMEVHGDHIFVIMRQPHFEDQLRVEQINLFFDARRLITVQEVEGDPFEPVRERIRTGGAGRIRHRGSDYLAYALIDALVDHPYPILERYGEKVEALEDELLEDPRPETLATIQQVKKDLLWLRRIAWPHREVVHALEREDTPLISAETRTFLRDCYDHAIQLMDVVETFREIAGGLTDLYLSSASNRMNEVMKVLTIMASIFIPLTFIAGIYGMNFSVEASRWNMPELNWAWGYPAALAAMAVIAAGMVIYFRVKRWL